MRSAEQLRDDALAIWRAGVDSVRPERLFADQVHLSGNLLLVGDAELSLDPFDRIVVVGGGKAGAGMARGLEASLGTEARDRMRLSGVVSVPADCVGPTEAVRLVAGRPAGVNEPRPEGAQAADEMLQLVGDLTPSDLCLCLLSGGASALLPAPIDGVSLDQKLAVTRLLSASGATINQLNAVRSALSQIKGGGLARACRAGALVTLILSDVLGDPLDVIGSGPTVDGESGPREALAVLADLGVADHPDAAPIVAKLQGLAAEAPATPPKREPSAGEAMHVVLGNNATAVDAAGVEAERRGYSHAMVSASASEGAAEEIGRDLARMAVRMRDEPGPDCLISGGEPTVKLADAAIRGRGGRNQQLTLAALAGLGGSRGVALLSGGTDGEDGPTDAAGAVVNEQVARAAAGARLDAEDALRRNDAYPFFEACGGLLVTGPTHTNVCDLRVVTVDQSAPGV